MTAAKPAHLAARRLLLDFLDLHPGRTVDADLDPLEAGIVGDTDHEDGGDSYHLGKDKIRARAGDDRYSVDESRRDQKGLDDYASAMDIGWFEVTTPRGIFTLRNFSRWLIGLCKSGDPDTADLREVIYSLDGVQVRRWDRLDRRSTGDSSHREHTHLSEHRDADGHRMLRLATRWLQHIGLIPEEDDVTPEDRTAIAQQTAALLRPDLERIASTETRRDATLLLALRQAAASLLKLRQQDAAGDTADADRDAALPGLVVDALGDEGLAQLLRGLPVDRRDAVIAAAQVA